MIKKKSNVRKYSRKVKNKKVKYSKKLMSGGALLSPSSSQKPKLLQPPPSLKNPLSFKFNTPFEKKIMELYEFSKLEADKDYISQIFRKFKYSYAQTNPAYKETDSILYLKKDEVDKEKNPTEVFKVYAPTNQSISIEYNYDKKFKDIGKFYEITPLELSVDTMQLAVNTGKLEISTDDKGNSYLGFVDFPSLVITEKPSGTGFSYSSRKNATWISVYEEKFEDEDKLFDLIETMDGRHIEQTTFDSEIESIDVKISKLDKDKNSSKISKISKLENSKPKKKGDIKMTNEELFIKKQEEIRILLSDIEISSDEKAKLKLKIEEQVKYRAYVKLEEDGDDGDDGDGSNKNVITEDISWAMKNSLWLEQYLQFKTNYMTSKKDSLKANELLLKIGKEYECDLSGLDKKYVIVDEFVNNGEGGDGLEYLICGYPEEKMKANILNFWQDEKMRVKLDTVHQNQKDNFYEWFSNLFNNYITEEIIKNKDSTELQNYKITDNRELFKIYKKQRQKFIIDYINDRYKNLITPKEQSIYDNFKIKYNINIEAYFQEIAKKYMNKIISYIKYIFIVYKKDKSNGNLIPFIFNIKELSNTHVPILERINKLIKNKLPSIFNIQEEYNTVDKYNTTDYNPDNEYKLFYSRYKYGKFFHIETEYLHTMTNVGYKAHIYKNSITLEEIQYASTIDIPYWKNIKFNYEVREHMLSNTTVKKKRSNNLIFRSETVLDAYIKDRIDKNDNRYEIEINAKNKSISIDNSRMEIEKKEQLLQNKKIKETLIKVYLEQAIIILMYKNSNNNYTFIFTYNNNFYSITFSPNLKYEIDNIINKIHNNKLYNGNINIYKINEYKQLNHEDYTIIFKYNPIILKQARQFSKDSNGENNNIDTSYFYDSNMLTLNNVLNYKTLIMPNLFIKDRPYIYLNRKIGKKYLDNYELYSKSKNQIKCELDYEEKFTDCEIKLCNLEEIIINCIFYNVNNCNYDFLEFIDNKDQKIVIYVFPHIGLPEKENELYLGNYLDLDGNKPTTMRMLKAIKDMYSNENYVCFLHVSISVIFYTLHFHVVSNKQYKRIYPKKEMGGFIIQDMFIDEVINNLKINPNYYKNLNFNLIKQY